MKHYRINSADLGVYITFTLLGAGLGLLIGSYVASLKSPEEDEDIIMEEVKPTITKSRLVKAKTPKFTLSAADQKEFDEIVANYAVSPAQISMVMAGLISPEDLRNVVEGSVSTITTDYTKPKPSLQDMLDESSGFGEYDPTTGDMAELFTVFVGTGGIDRPYSKETRLGCSAEGELCRMLEGRLIPYKSEDDWPFSGSVVDEVVELLADGNAQVYVTDLSENALYIVSTAALWVEPKKPTRAKRVPKPKDDANETL